MASEEMLRGLECPVCREHFQEPRILPCGHTFCLDPCLKQIAGNKTQIRCPECRAQHQVPNGGTEQFLKNVAISRQLDFLATSDESPRLSLTSCPLCGEEDELHKCGHCEKTICFVCINQHLPHFKEKIRDFAMEVRDEASDASTTYAKHTANLRKYLEKNVESAEAKIEAATKRAIAIIENKSKELKKDVQDFHQKELASISGKDQWKSVTGFCDEALLELQTETITYSPAKLTKLREEIEEKRQSLSRVDTRPVINLQEQRAIDVDINLKILEDISNIYTLKVSTKGQLDEERAAGAHNSHAQCLSLGINTYTPLLDKNISRLKLKFGACGSFPGQFSNPQVVAIDRTTGEIVVVDEDNHRIQRFESTGKLSLCFGSRASGPYEFSHPKGIAINEQSQMIISDQYNHRLKIHNRDGSLQRVIGKYGYKNGMFNYPSDLALDNGGNIHVCDRVNHRVQILGQDGSYLWQYKPANCWQPCFIAISASNAICISNGHKCVILDGQYQLVCSWDVEGTVSGLCIHEDSYVLVSDTSYHRIMVYSMAGDLLKVFDFRNVKHTSSVNQLRAPRGLAIDSNGDVFVACSSMIVKF